MARQKVVKVKIKKDGSGTMNFDLDGFVGNECDSIKELEDQMGMIQEREATEDAHLYEIPDPAFNELAQ